MSEKRFRVLKYSVLDTWTGLKWQKGNSPEMMTWDEAMKYAKSLRLGRHADWRLPTIEELITLIDFSRRNPASSFPGMPSDGFWSSSSYSGSSSNAWYVYFYPGNVNSDDKSYVYAVRCVRRGSNVAGRPQGEDK